MAPHRFALVDRERVTSTQDEARSLARAGAPSGIIVVADEQTAGRGRGERAWISAPRLGLWMTLILRPGRPAAEWPALTSLAALAVCNAVEDLGFGLEPRIRWPNDVMLSGRKFCGVLAEIEGKAVLLGIGLNVLHRPEDFPDAIREIATSLDIERQAIRPPDPEEGSQRGQLIDQRGQSIDREAALDRILERLDAIVDAFESEGPGPAIARVWERSIVRGRRVRIGVDGDRTVTGEAVGLGGIGELRVRIDGGDVVEIASGTYIGMEGS